MHVTVLTLLCVALTPCAPQLGRERRNVAAMPAPQWFWRFMYDCESAAWGRRRDEPEHRRLVERTVSQLVNVVAPPGPVADLGCGPGSHTLELARRGYDVVGIDGSVRMVDVARERAAHEKISATFKVHDVRAQLDFPDGFLAGAISILLLQHLPEPDRFLADIRRCLQPGGHLLITAPSRDRRSHSSESLYWRLRASLAHNVPGFVRFYDTSSLSRLIEGQDLKLVWCEAEPGGVTALART